MAERIAHRTALARPKNVEVDESTFWRVRDRPRAPCAPRDCSDPFPTVNRDHRMIAREKLVRMIFIVDAEKATALEGLPITQVSDDASRDFGSGAYAKVKIRRDADRLLLENSSTPIS